MPCTFRASCLNRNCLYTGFGEFRAWFVFGQTQKLVILWCILPKKHKNLWRLWRRGLLLSRGLKGVQPYQHFEIHTGIWYSGPQESMHGAPFRSSPSLGRSTFDPQMLDFWVIVIIINGNATGAFPCVLAIPSLVWEEHLQSRHMLITWK